MSLTYTRTRVLKAAPKRGLLLLVVTWCSLGGESVVLCTTSSHSSTRMRARVHVCVPVRRSSGPFTVCPTVSVPLAQMIVQLGPLVTDVAGSIGGTTFQRSSIGTLVRAKPSPTRRRTFFTAAERTSIGVLSLAWRFLSQSDRDQWDLVAASMTWTNRFGQVIQGRGYWLFQRANALRALQGQAPLSTPATPVPLDQLLTPLLTVGPANNFVFTDLSLTNVGGQNYWYLFATPLLSAGISADYRRSRFIGSIDPGVALPFDFTSMWSARFNQPYSAGTRLFLTVLPVQDKAGYPGVPVTRAVILP